VASTPCSAIQLVEHENQLHVCAGAIETLDAFNHPQPSRPKWRFPLVGLLCVILPFMIVTWGTAYKLSLYTTAKTGAPAKVCTRGSDAAMSSVSHAIDGRKVAENGVVPSLPVYVSLVPLALHEVGLGEANTVIRPLPSGRIRAARPPPIRFPFSS
jgi:hypothetical protein